MAPSASFSHAVGHMVTTQTAESYQGFRVCFSFRVLSLLNQAQTKNTKLKG